MIFQEAVELVKQDGYSFRNRGESKIIIELRKLLDDYNGYYIELQESYDELHTMITDLGETRDTLDYDDEYYEEICAKYGCHFDRDSWKITKEFTKLEDLKDYIKMLDEFSIWGKMNMTCNTAKNTLKAYCEIEEVAPNCQKIIKNKSKKENYPYVLYLKLENDRLFLTDNGENLKGIDLDKNIIEKYTKILPYLTVENNVIEKDFCEYSDVVLIISMLKELNGLRPDIEIK